MQLVSPLYRELIEKENHYFESALSVGLSGVLVDEKGDVLIFGHDSLGDEERILVDAGTADTAYRENILRSIETSHSVFNEDYPVVGGAVSGEIDIKMFKPAAEVPRRARLVPYVRVCDATRQSEWIQKGVYFVDTREYTNNDDGIDTLTIHGYDSMMLFEISFPSDTGDGLVVRDGHGNYLDVDIVRFMAGYEGINIPVDSRTISRMDKGYEFPLFVGYSCREVLGIIAASYGGNFVISDTGQLLLIRLCDLPRETSVLTDQNGVELIFGYEDEEPIFILV